MRTQHILACAHARVCKYALAYIHICMRMQHAVRVRGVLCVLHALWAHMHTKCFCVCMPSQKQYPCACVCEYPYVHAHAVPARSRERHIHARLPRQAACSMPYAYKACSAHTHPHTRTRILMQPRMYLHARTVIACAYQCSRVCACALLRCLRVVYCEDIQARMRECAACASIRTCVCAHAYAHCALHAICAYICPRADVCVRCLLRAACCVPQAAGGTLHAAMHAYAVKSEYVYDHGLRLCTYTNAEMQP